MLQISLRIIYAFNSIALFILGLIALIGPWLLLAFPQNFLTSITNTTGQFACNRIALSSQILGVVLCGMAILLFATALRKQFSETYLAGLIGQILGHTMWIAAVVAFAWLATSSSRNDNLPKILFHYSGFIIVAMVACIMFIVGIVQVRLVALMRQRLRQHLQQPLHQPLIQRLPNND